jgi:predicted transcriptional regulator
MGTVEQPLNPISVAIGAEATFVARTIDTNVKHMSDILTRAAQHKGTSFVEIYQNCVIYNDDAFQYATDAKIKADNVLELEHGKPMVFGKNRDKGIRLNELDPEIVSLETIAEEDLLVHREDAREPSLAYLLSRMTQPEFPEPIGVFRCIEREAYEAGVLGQVATAVKTRGQGNLRKLYHAADTWEVTAKADAGSNGHQATTQGPTEEKPSEFDEEYTGVVFHGEATSGPKVEYSLTTDRVSVLQPKKPLTANVDISLAEAIRLLKETNVGFLALVDGEGKLAGVFTEGDVFTKVACNVEDLGGAKVRDYMTTNVTTIKADTTIAYALHLMSIHHFRHVPIVDDEGRPTGVISFRSVVHYLRENFPANGQN